MKAQKKLNVVLIILVIALISIISFGGIFYQSKSKMLDIIPEYTLGTDLTGYRKVTLAVSPVEEDNSQEVKTYENYVKSASIIKKRLASMKITDYTVRCDESTGQIEITLPENKQTDYILSDITQKGKFEIVDSTDKKVLMNNEDIKNVKVQTVESSYSNSTNVYMAINFDNKGTRTFKDITKNYQNVVTNETTNETANETVNEPSENNTSEETNTTEDEHNHDEEDNKEETKKQVSLNLDGTSMMTTTFSEVIDNGVLSLSLGSTTTSEDKKIKMYQADSLAAILENDTMPIQYTVTGNVYISSPIEESNIDLLIYVAIAIVAIILIVTIIKYRTKGLAISLSNIGFVALYLLVLRYTNVILSLNGIFAIGAVFAINHIFNIMYISLLEENKEDAFMKTLKKFSLGSIPILILAVVCCFSSWMSIFSFGMVLFWGLIVNVIYNSVVTQFLLRNMSK